MGRDGSPARASDQPQGVLWLFDTHKKTDTSGVGFLYREVRPAFLLRRHRPGEAGHATGISRRSAHPVRSS